MICQQLAKHLNNDDKIRDIATDMTVAKLTPQQAADRANVSRGTIMNAIKNGSLIAFRDNRNCWQIDDNELSKWLSLRTDIATGNSVNSDSQMPVPIDENVIRIAVLESELRGKDQRITDLERDRDDWKAQAQELARRDIPSVPPDPPFRRRRWWPF